MHRRTLIRQAVAALLTAGSTAAGTRVTAMRLVPYADNEPMPTLNVDTPAEQVVREAESGGTPVYEVALDLEVAAVMQSGPMANNWSQALDSLCDEVQAVIPSLLAGLDWVENVTYTGTQISALTDTRIPFVVASLAYKVTYYTEAHGVNASNLPDLTRIAMDWDMASPSLPGGGPDGQIDAQDLIILPN